MPTSFNEFTTAYQNLNAQQREAADTISGSVCVIAGPGTGKTQLLSVRIGRMLLSDAQILPENILCLTYTEAAAHEMRHRLQKYIGTEANKITINTFHGFCNSVIREHPSIFSWVKGEEMITELDQNLLIESLIKELPLRHPLLKGKMDHKRNEKGILKLVETLKKENWNWQEIIAAIPAYRVKTIVPENKEFYYQRKHGEHQKGDVKNGAIQKFDEAMVKTEEALKLSHQYMQRMKDEGKYDFQDMILWVIRAFQEHPWLLLHYQERYQYILVDEYQDTNGAQNEILRLLTNYWRGEDGLQGEGANIFVVGDDDQAIYAFQGAEVGNIHRFIEEYQPRLITLEENYRSSTPILNVAAQSIAFNSERLSGNIPGIEKNLKARGIHKDLDQAPQISVFGSIEEESTAICKQIDALLEQGTPPETIAILFKKNEMAGPYITHFQQKKIPFSYSRSQNLLELPLGQHLLTILDWFIQESKEPGSGMALFFKITYLPYIQLHPTTAGYLMIHLGELAKKQTKYTPLESMWRSALQESSPPKGITTEDWETLRQLLKDLDDCWIILHADTVQVFFQKVLERFGILEYICVHPEKSLLIQQCAIFFDHLKSVTAANPTCTLEDWFQILQEIQRLKTRDLVFEEFLGKKGGVALTTVHSAKGKEWPYVFMIGCTNTNWENAWNPGETFKLPDPFQISTPQNIEELRRLFYVGMTRAKEALSISAVLQPKPDGIKGKSKNPSRFVQEILESNPPNTFTALPPPDLDDQLTLTIESLRPKPILQTGMIDHDKIDQILEQYRLSPTHLDKYLKCPITFYFETILRVPGPRTPSMGYGTAIHAGIKHGLDQFGKQNIHAIHEAVEEFQTSMKYHASHFTKNDFQRYIEQGKHILPLFLQSLQVDLEGAEDLRTEYRVTHAESNGIPIKGVIDLIYCRAGLYTIVDFKTGTPEMREKLAFPSEKQPFGGNYWRQLIFYKILLQSQLKHPIEKGAIIPVVDPEIIKDKKSEILYTNEMEDMVRNQIKQAWDGIKAHDFERGCQEKTCTWCQVLRYRKLTAYTWSLDDEENMEEG